MKKIILLVMLVLPSLVWAEGEGNGNIDIRDKMTMREFTEAGLNKLSAEEVDALNKWLNRYVGGEEGQQTDGEEEKNEEETKKSEESFLGSLFSGPKLKTYKIEKVESGYYFIINKNPFTSASVCPGYKEGDKVVFAEGRANGMCEEAEFSRPDGSDSCVVYCR